MPRWDDPRGPRHDQERERWRRDQMQGRAGPGGERRSFDDEWRRAEPRGQDRWMNDRDAARYDQDRASYGRRYADAGEAAEARRRRDEPRFGVNRGGEPYAYGGQEYGEESRSERPGERRGPGWGFERNDERRRGFDFDDPGVGQSQAGYAPSARSPHEHDFDPDYLRWREEQMRSHDRDYQDWRRDQHRQYDEQYRQFRGERQRHFGQAFHEWRSQRSAVGGAPDTGVAPGVSGYGDKTGIPGGYNAAGAYDKPSGVLDPPGHLSTDPALSQRGGSQASAGAAQPSGGDRSPEFGKEPAQVKATSQGETQGREAHKNDEQSKDGDVRRT